MSKKEERDEVLVYEFNEGRLNADKKWLNAIDERIAELEQQVGIPELRRLKKSTMYRWNNLDDDDSENVTTHNRRREKKGNKRKNV